MRHANLLTISSCLLLTLGCDGGTSVARRAEPAGDTANAKAKATSPHALPTPGEGTSEQPRSADSGTDASASEAGREERTGSAGAGAAAGGESTALVADGKLELPRLTLTVPEGWENKPVSSNFLLAEFLLPRATGDDADGRLTVSVAGGSVEANIDRWRVQFGGNPAKSSQSEETVNGLKVTVVELTGEFNDQRGPFAPAAKHSGYTMLAAIIPVEKELHFIKAVGPQATIAAHGDRIRSFVSSATKK